MDKTKLEQIAAMLQQAQSKVAEFKRDTYEESFNRHLEENAAVWCLLHGVIAQDGEEQQEEIRQTADALALRAEAMLAEAKNRTAREKLRLNLNLYMVSYFLPAIVAYERKCGTAEGEREKLTAAICDRWAASFKNRIQTADYESICGGFKQKLCFVTTAVCQGLHKPQDCREVTVMKRYRDEYLLGCKDGEALVREYYDIAPTIVKRIAKDASSEAKYRYLWDRYISRCVELLDHGRNEACRETYEAMMMELKEEYMVTDRTERK